MIVYGTAEYIEKDPERFDIFKNRLAGLLACRLCR